MLQQQLADGACAFARAIRQPEIKTQLENAVLNYSVLGGRRGRAGREGRALARCVNEPAANARTASNDRVIFAGGLCGRALRLGARAEPRGLHAGPPAPPPLLWFSARGFRSTRTEHSCCCRLQPHVRVPSEWFSFSSCNSSVCSARTNCLL